MKQVSNLSVPLADINHPVTNSKAKELYNQNNGEIENFKKIFYYVRDEIYFGFPKVWDQIPASDTIREGMGYCNSKAILMQALCTLNHIPVKLRAGQIQTKIMKGIFPFWSFPFTNQTAAHMWVEVKLNHRWYPMDAYILDHEFYIGAKDLYIRNNKSLGFALGDIEITENGEWYEGFIQTNAIAEDIGIWKDAIDFYSSKSYNGLNYVQRKSLPLLLNIANQRIRKIRNYGQNLINTVGIARDIEFVM